jgi:hypothetical protein
MKKTTPRSKRSNPYIRSLLVSGLTLSNLLPYAAPILAVGTQGGTSISNTATATFDDPNGGGTTTIKSNTVQITVAEVAGISVTNSGFTDTNGSSVTTDDILYYEFRITNTGNDATEFYLPAPTIAGATLETSGYTMIDKNGTPFTTAIDLGAGGVLTGASSIATALGNQGVLKADEYITVRVAVKVTATTVGDNVTVTLGDGIGDAENLTAEVRTKDTDSATYTGTGEAAAAAPINGEQEGTATRTVQVGTAPKYTAFATVLKTNVAPILNNVTTTQDDVVEYGLQLKVSNSAPAGTAGYTVTDLQPVESVKFSTAKNTAFGSATDKNVVIISDVIPTNTRLSVSGDAGYQAPAVPTDGSGVAWKVWYAYNATVNSSNLAANTPLEDVWTDQAPANATEAANVKRIAFVKESSVARGVTTTAGTFRVVTNGVATTGGDIYNIAQVVGQSESGTGKNLVYDESGDQNPNNFDGSNPASDSDYTPSQFNDNTNTETGNVTDLGGTLSANQDPGNNTGTGASGEVNKVTIGAAISAGLLNGPSGSPGATGPTNTQDDFTNKSIDGVTGDQSTSVTIDPGVVSFTNTVASANTINNVVIRPISATEASAVDSSTADNASFSIDTALPDTTEVTVIALVNGTYQSATYTYSSGSGTFTLSSSKSGTNADGSGGTTDTTAKPIVYPTFIGGQTYNYTVQVNLPGTAQTLKGYSVPMVAYVEGDLPTDTANYGTLNLTGNADQAPNVTIDRVYTGFMKVLKEVRILDANGAAIPASDPRPDGISTFSSDTAVTATYQPKPGERIEYRISYENISSTAGSSSGSVVLNASNFMVIEDGLASPNNWAGVTTHVLSGATGTGSVTFYNSAINVASPGSGVVEATSNSGYVNSVGTVIPGGTGNFTFQRGLN